MNLSKLKDPFREAEVEFRLAQAGESGRGVWAKCLAYITSRAIQERLDEVCGPENWTVAYEFIAVSGVICNLSIKIGDEWVTKSDGAEMTKIEPFKGGISSALKRAGSAWGIGRYLYLLEEGFATIVDRDVDGAQYGKTKSGKDFYWIPPRLPAWALPALPARELKPSNAEDAADAVKKPEEESAPPPPDSESQEAITKRKWLFATGHDCGWKEADWKAAILKKWNFTSTKQLSPQQIAMLVQHMKENPKRATSAASLIIKK